MATIWALIVGVGTVVSTEYPDVPGAAVDADNVFRYIHDDRQVPTENIVTLKNEEATRGQIIRKFQEHLIDNPAINKGDALLFYFSGHGSRLPAPQGWSVVESADDQQLVEAIVPHNEGAMGSDGKEIPSIPDYTIASLLTKAAKHGDNITVVLDCCHSGHGCRDGRFPERESGEETDDDERLWVRGVPPEKLAPLRLDVDAEVLGLSDSQASGSRSETLPRGGFTTHRAKSYVLVAACRQNEQALGGRKGGLLTTNWLHVLRSSAHLRSYSQVMKDVSERVENMIQKFSAKYPDAGPFSQHPQCEGLSQDRIVFKDSIPAHKGLFSISLEDNKKCRIFAGDLHGIQIHTSFEICQIYPNAKDNKVVGTAIAIRVDAVSCLAELEGELSTDDGQYYLAQIIGQVQPLKYFIALPDSITPDVRRTHDKIREGVDTLSRSVAFPSEDPADADLVLEVGSVHGGGITLKRQDPILRSLKTNLPRLDREDVDLLDFGNLLNAVARFNTFVSQTSPAHPFDGRLEIKLHILKPARTPGDFEKPECREIQEEVPLTTNDEFEIRESDSDYAFTIHNSSTTDLFVYLVYFDPGTYGISVWYSPATPETPTLLAGKTLQIGGSAEHASPFEFFIRPGDKIDTSFLRLFVVDSPAEISFMEQNDLIGRGEYHERFSRQRFNNTDPVATWDGKWDCLTRRLTVRK
ncbi:hypothetical protein NLI96_g3477 [Meripilus lineatus]|uniref:Peptidase C14 caspase domain-containing protein n=1 Tax=Meripilus lineatus TaxID=2056292 RepID=A0AAD5YJ23_9APHY|nr:hypothetical protein NLI96_g3477 [Physisporinus lineatus]